MNLIRTESVLTHDKVRRFAELPEMQRIAIIQSMTPTERGRLATLLDEIVVNPFAKYVNDPVAFISDQMGLDETIWGKQIEIAYSLVEYSRTACKASHSNGKTFLFGRLGVWWLVTRPLGEAMLLTTAPTNRQVEHILWKEIRHTHHRAFLKDKGFGEILTKQWKHGSDTIGLGASPRKQDESAFQGFHSPYLLLLVDEAGGIPHIFGNALESITTGDNTKVALIGNPPTDEENSWFQQQCESGLYNVISIPATSTPNFTGEKTGKCKTCSPNSPEHLINAHLVDKKWVRDVIRTFGKDSNFVRARVYAKFPTSSSSKVLPSDWLERACLNESPVKGDSLEMGVDVAADGGDEFVIAIKDGWTGKIVHRSSGAENNNTILLGQKVLKWILACELVHKKRGNLARIRVKVDVIGVGRGLTDWLKLEGSKGHHHAEIIGINVSESASTRQSQRFTNKRADMWWNFRDLIQPDSEGNQKAKLLLYTGEREDGEKIIDYEMLSQFASPTYFSKGSGTIAIESKVDIKKRLGRSPDAAEAMLLAFYNPSISIDSIQADNSSLAVNPVMDFSNANDSSPLDFGMSTGLEGMI